MTQRDAIKEAGLAAWAETKKSRQTQGNAIAVVIAILQGNASVSSCCWICTHRHFCIV